MYVVTCSIVFTLATIVFAAKCPSGGEIYSFGISEQGKKDVVNQHNKYRQQIMNGQVPGQPKGKNLLTMIYDVPLGNKAAVVSNTCKMEHIIAKDDRWGWVGQNLYISWSSAKTTDQDWNSAVAAWFAEYKNFIYPNKSNGKVTGHYTQVVWAKSKNIGCHFIAFYDTNQPKYPYARLYSCNYGPGGNFNNEAPYELA